KPRNKNPCLLPPIIRSPIKGPPRRRRAANTEALPPPPLIPSAVEGPARPQRAAKKESRPPSPAHPERSRGTRSQAERREERIPAPVPASSRAEVRNPPAGSAPRKRNTALRPRIHK